MNIKGLIVHVMPTIILLICINIMYAPVLFVCLYTLLSRAIFAIATALVLRNVKQSVIRNTAQKLLDILHVNFGFHIF